MSTQEFEAVIGLEIHAQIAVQSKMFCSCSSDSFEQDPNINVCPVCMGFPGQLPVINQEAVMKGLKAALALQCSVPSFCKFDRKNYFYPDLPKGFQISQYDEPLAEHGVLEVEVVADQNDQNAVQEKKVRIRRLHLEDDAGKLTHVAGGTLCDYNRSGIALMEIVSEPDIHSAVEAAAYARAMQVLLRYVQASEADMEKGMMRFDASVSIRPKGDMQLYPRAEIKNLNSFRSLESAITYEIKRQENLWKEGNPLQHQITVGWNDDEQKTYFLRDKEEADDYRYFPEPDLPPLVFEPQTIEDIKISIPELPLAKRQRYIKEYNMSQADALFLSADPGLAAYFEKVVEVSNDPKKATSFVATILLAQLKKTGLSVEELKLRPEALGDLIILINEGKISMNIAKGEVFEEMFATGRSAQEVIAEKGLTQVSDEGALEEMCRQVLSENAQSIADYRAGKKQAFFFLVGQIMKQTKGQANPQLVTDILERLLQAKD